MQPFTIHRGVVAPLPRANVDTDAIIPKQFLKSIARSGFGQFLFDAWRYHDVGYLGIASSQRQENQEFVLNQAPYRQASILLAGENFGCGSSREHAAWALQEFGIRVIIAPSFANIFYDNCSNNGVLLIATAADWLPELFARCQQTPGYSLDVDLAQQTLSLDDGTYYRFDIEPQRRNRLLQGLDEIALTLQDADKITAFEQGYRQRAPWLFQS